MFVARGAAVEFAPPAAPRNGDDGGGAICENGVAMEPWDAAGPDPAYDPGHLAIRGTLATSRHASMLFDMVVDALGELAYVETLAGATRKVLFRREGSALIPWPLLELDVRGRISTVVPLAGPPGASFDPPPRPGQAPRLRGLGPGEIVLHDGPATLTVTFGADGRWCETSHGPPFGGVLDALRDDIASPVERLALYLARRDPGRHGPGRLHCPAPLPSVRSAWCCGRGAIREALHEGSVPAAARWAVVDAYRGEALAFGDDLAGTLEKWRAACARSLPLPPEPVAPPPPPPEAPEGVIAIVAHGAPPDVAWPEPGLERTPFVVLPLEPLRQSAQRLWSPVRMLGGRGGTVHGLLRLDADGFTLVGEELADLIELDHLDGTLAQVRQFEPPGVEQIRSQWPTGNPPYDSHCTVYRLIDERTHRPVTPAEEGSSRGYGFSGRSLDGDHLRFRVLRQRRLC